MLTQATKVATPLGELDVDTETIEELKKSVFMNSIFHL